MGERVDRPPDPLSASPVPLVLPPLLRLCFSVEKFLWRIFCVYVYRGARPQLLIGFPEIVLVSNVSESLRMTVLCSWAHLKEVNGVEDIIPTMQFLFELLHWTRDLLRFEVTRGMDSAQIHYDGIEGNIPRMLQFMEI